MEKKIERVAVGEILDGRIFYIPSYQRGYRWEEKQVTDLLKDLLSFACKNKTQQDEANRFDYYCLQPIVIREISDSNAGKIREEYNLPEDKTIWEVVDGQQRLTTLFILFKYLSRKYLSEEEFMSDYGCSLFTLVYQTRKDSYRFLNEIGLDSADNQGDNIDYYYIQQNYKIIKNWIENKEDYSNTGSCLIAERYGYGLKSDGDIKPKEIRDLLIGILTNQKNSTGSVTSASVQFIWYQLSETTDVIYEFRKINTGKIKLTEAELIKALFLRKNNFEGERDSADTQYKKSIEWEEIENMLHDDSFWYFLNKRNTDLPNRIDFLLNLVYKYDATIGKSEEEWSDTLKGLKDNYDSLRKTQGCVIFNWYLDKFERLQGKELSKEIDIEWKKIKEIYDILVDWYNNVECYNLIGYLNQGADDILPLMLARYKSSNSNARLVFKEYLYERIKERIKDIEITEDYIGLDYKDRELFNMLLLINIIHLNIQAEEGIYNAEEEKDISDIDVSMYKFPFSVFSNMTWNIEHIDSYTENALEGEDLKKWVFSAFEDVKGILREEEVDNIKQLIENEEFSNAYDEIRDKLGEYDADDIVKNNICNLTLLDEKTNCGYGNALFLSKRKMVLQVIKGGRFEPISTMYVFAKLFDETGTNRSKWGEDDMKNYRKYIYDTIDIIRNPSKEATSISEEEAKKEGFRYALITENSPIKWFKRKDTAMLEKEKGQKIVRI